MRRAAFAMLAALANSASPAREEPLSRAQWLAEGEAALVALDTQRAERAFDRAASMAHSADAEIGLVRTYMQEGEYRRALSFAAHTAQGHRDDLRGAALYASLLDLGGQGQPAKRILADVTARFPNEPLPRFAPCGAIVERGAASGTAWLFDGGRHALVPIATLRGESRVWVRNGLGALARARVEKRSPSTGIAVLAIDPPLVVSESTMAAPRDPFPGSVAYVVEYPRTNSGAPAWPMLRAGFVGAPLDDGRLRKLDVDGAQGGPVYDAAGRFAGIAVAGNRAVSLRLVPRSQLASLIGPIGGPGSKEAMPASMPADAIYESALRDAVQVIVSR